MAGCPSNPKRIRKETLEARDFFNGSWNFAFIPYQVSFWNKIIYPTRSVFETKPFTLPSQFLKQSHLSCVTIIHNLFQNKVIHIFSSRSQCFHQYKIDETVHHLYLIIFGAILIFLFVISSDFWKVHIQTVKMQLEWLHFTMLHWIIISKCYFMKMVKL